MNKKQEDTNVKVCYNCGRQIIGSYKFDGNNYYCISLDCNSQKKKRNVI